VKYLFGTQWVRRWRIFWGGGGEAGRDRKGVKEVSKERSEDGRRFAEMAVWARDGARIRGP